MASNGEVADHGHGDPGVQASRSGSHGLYMEAMYVAEQEKIAAMLPSTTRARNPTVRMPYPNVPTRQGLVTEAGERQRPLPVMKATEKDYVIPLTRETVTAYPHMHGIRDRPGGKVSPVEDQARPHRTAWKVATCSHHGRHLLHSREGPSGVVPRRRLWQALRRPHARSGGHHIRIHHRSGRTWAWTRTGALREDGPRALRPGVRKRLRHSARKALQNSRVARHLVSRKVAEARWPRQQFGYDLIEIFGGAP